MAGAIPVIDIAPFRDGGDKPGIAAAVAAACRSTGFLMIDGHGIAPDTLANAFRLAGGFFDLDDAAKARFHPRGPSRQRGYHGYATRGLGRTLDRALGADSPPDLRESIFLGPIDDHRAHFSGLPGAAEAYAPNLIPNLPGGFDDALIALYRAFETLSANLLRIFAVALGEPEGRFAADIDRHFSILACHFYPPQREAPAPGQLRTGAHTDFGAMTILAVEAGRPGLEVKMPDGAWRAIEPAPGCLIVNLGDMMARWTNDRWVSTLHRVANPARTGDAASRRLSIGYFMHPNYDAEVRCIAGCLAAGARPRYAPISAGEHIAAKIAASHKVSG